MSDPVEQARELVLSQMAYGIPSGCLACDVGVPYAPCNCHEAVDNSRKVDTLIAAVRAERAAEVERLTAALRRYGECDRDCYVENGGPCDCGFVAALRGEAAR